DMLQLLDSERFLVDPVIPRDQETLERAMRLQPRREEPQIFAPRGQNLARDWIPSTRGDPSLALSGGWIL
ncbi:MAG: hypothetical protein ACREDM_13670, partial [Methylocella sp.]